MNYAFFVHEKHRIDAAVEAERLACEQIAHAWETDYQLKLTNGSASRDIAKRRKTPAEAS